MPAMPAMSYIPQMSMPYIRNPVPFIPRGMTPRFEEQSKKDTYKPPLKTEFVKTEVAPVQQKVTQPNMPSSSKPVENGNLNIIKDSAIEHISSSKPPLQPAEVKQKQEEEKDKKATGDINNDIKIYTVEYLLTFRTTCNKRPKDMRPIDIQRKSGVGIAFSPYVEVQRSETAEAVRNLRILLNKLAKENFARISDTILNTIQYNEEILQELANILFNKCVKEHKYIEVYMQLVDQLIAKFKPPKKGKEGEKSPQKGPVLNFKKMFIEQCQNTFKEKSTEEFMKSLPTDIDEEEKKSKRKQRMFGNTKLIGQLFIRGNIPEVAIKDILEERFKNITEDNVENLCLLFLTIGKPLYEKFAYEANQTTNKRKPRFTTKFINKEIFDDYIDKLVAMKQQDSLSSRIKFMIQDVIDAKNDEWSLAFDLYPVPAGEGNGKVAAYKKSKSTDKSNVPLPGPPPPVPEIPTDPKLEGRELRKKSMNEQNIYGRNIENYQKTKLDEKVLRRLHNAIDEYLDVGTIKDVVDTLYEVMDNEKIERKICVGHYILWGFSKKPKDFVTVYKMVIEMYKSKNIEQIDIQEGIIVALANFYDTLIDNPNSPDQFKEMLNAFEAEKLITKEEIANALVHINEMKKQLEEEYA